MQRAGFKFVGCAETPSAGAPAHFVKVPHRSLVYFWTIKKETVLKLATFSPGLIVEIAKQRNLIHCIDPFSIQSKTMENSAESVYSAKIGIF